MLQNSDEKAIDVYIKNYFQETPEDMARKMEHKEIVELLEVWTELKQLKTIKENIAKWKKARLNTAMDRRYILKAIEMNTLLAEEARLETLKRKFFN